MLMFIIFYALATIVSALFFKVGCRWLDEKHDLLTNFTFSLIWWAWWPTVAAAALLAKYHPNA